MFYLAALFQIIELDYEAPAGLTLEFYTGTPTDAITLRETHFVPISTTRRTVKIRLKSTTKGKQYKVRITSQLRVILYGGRVYARPLGIAGAAWAWHALPIDQTASLFRAVPLPIDPTGDTFRAVKIPIDETGDTFRAVKIPIDETGDKFRAVKIPMHGSPELTTWIDVPVAR